MAVVAACLWWALLRLLHSQNEAGRHSSQSKPEDCTRWHPWAGARSLCLRLSTQETKEPAGSAILARYLAREVVLEHGETHPKMPPRTAASTRVTARETPAIRRVRVVQVMVWQGGEGSARQEEGGGGLLRAQTQAEEGGGEGTANARSLLNKG